MNIMIFAEKIKKSLYMKFKDIFIFAIFFLTSQIAHAATVSLSGAQISEFEQIYISGSSGSTFQTHQTVDGVTFLTYFIMADGISSAAIGDVDAGFDWSIYDTYTQSIKNYDENPWNFSLTVTDSSFNFAESLTVELAPQEEQIFSVNLLDLASRNPINEVYVTISADLSLPGNDSVAEYELSFGLGSVSEVPLPSGIILLLSALSGLLLARRAGK